MFLVFSQTDVGGHSPFFGKSKIISSANGTFSEEKKELNWIKRTEIKILNFRTLKKR